ncbi:2962_t:CDS:2, partial [Funneliformis mosseae]
KFKKHTKTCALPKKIFHCTAKLNPDPLPGKVLTEPIAKLLKKPSSSWTKEDVIPVARILAGRITVDGAGDNLEGANLYASICEDFATFLYKHPNIRAIVDPVYVVADLNTVNDAIPVNLYPAGENPAVPLINFMGINHVWAFNGQGEMGRAQHFIGWLQGN